MRFLFLVLFMALSSAVQAQEAQGVAPKGPAVQEQPNRSADDTGDYSWKSALPVRVVESPEDSKDRRDSEKKTQQHDTDDLDAQRRAAKAAESSAATAEGQIIPTWIQAGVAIIGTAALLVTIWFSIKATNAAVRSADLAEKAIATVETAAQQQLRAYVHIDDISLEWEEGQHEFGKTLRVRPIWKNVGQTPARNVQWSTSYELGVVDNVFTFPGRRYDTTTTLGTEAITRDVSVAIVDAENIFQRGDGPITVYGSIEYNDIFIGTTLHRTEFHIYVDTTSASEAEPKCQIYTGERHNGADSDCLLPPGQSAHDRTSARKFEFAT